ncbi:hypothetical protein P8452_17268 [Trifolium repens]|nr:hypothetical protein P8452_17268 [Trifolium repens]
MDSSPNPQPRYQFIPKSLTLVSVLPKSLTQIRRGSLTFIPSIVDSSFVKDCSVLFPDFCVALSIQG